MSLGEKETPSIREPDHVLGGINALMRALHNLDERGLILSLAAFAEDSLGALLKSFLLPNQAARDLLEGFNAPLGTLSSRIRAALALGLITKDQYDDLEHLRKIRNEFSHTWQPISFSDQHIAAHIKAINFSNGDDDYPETAIEKVRSALSFLLVELQVNADRITKASWGARNIGTRLMSGVTEGEEDQIELSKNRLAELEDKILNSTGEKRAFFLMVRERWVERLSLLETSMPANRRPEVSKMRQELIRRISGTKET
jgi:Mannitol repressor